MFPVGRGGHLQYNGIERVYATGNSRFYYFVLSVNFFSVFGNTCPAHGRFGAVAERSKFDFTARRT